MSLEKETSVEQHETVSEAVNDVAVSKEWAHAEGKKGADQEHQMTLLQGIKGYPGAIMWSVLLSTAIIMEGYDIVLIGNLVRSRLMDTGIY